MGGEPCSSPAALRSSGALRAGADGVGRAVAAPGNAVEHARKVRFRDQHLARLGTLVARDHAAPLHHVDQPAGARVAHAQAPLEHRRGRGAHLDHRRDSLGEEVVSVGIEVTRVLAILRLDGLEQVLLQLGLPGSASARSDARSPPRSRTRP